MTPTNQTAPAIPGCISRLVVGSSDTPETDERAFHCWRWDTHKMDYTPYGEVVTSTYARRIERERNALRALARFVADQMENCECDCIDLPNDPEKDGPQNHSDYCPIYIADYCRRHIPDNAKSILPESKP